MPTFKHWTSIPTATTVNNQNTRLNYSRQLRKIKMEILDDGTGRLVGSRRHLPYRPRGRVFNDLYQPHSEASSPSSSAPQMMMDDDYCAPTTQPTIMGPPFQASEHGVDTQKVNPLPELYYQYIQYPIGDYFKDMEQYPLAYMMFPDSDMTTETVVSDLEDSTSAYYSPAKKLAGVKKAKMSNTPKRPRSGQKKVTRGRKKTTP